MAGNKEKAKSLELTKTRRVRHAPNMPNLMRHASIATRRVITVRRSRNVTTSSSKGKGVGWRDLQILVFPLLRLEEQIPTKDLRARITQFASHG